MFQIYAHGVTRLLDSLMWIESLATQWSLRSPEQDEVVNVVNLLKGTQKHCTDLMLVSSKKQVTRILERMTQVGWSAMELRGMVEELRRRINEDLEEMVFYCVNEPTMIRQFFKETVNEKGERYLNFKPAEDLFDPTIVERWPEITEDIIESCRCYVMGRSTASAFHLMRIVEFGILKVARVADIQDPKASWGAILGQMARYAFRTKYEELPQAVKPHIELIRELLPKMQAIQHAWRNSKVVHINQKLVPIDTITPQMAEEMIIAVRAFMRLLAVQLPTEEEFTGLPHRF